MESILEYIEDKVLLFDGAMGTRLSEKGWDMKSSSETLNITSPDLVKEIHEEYIKAGAKVITTNTFMCNIFNEEKYGYILEDVIEKGINMAQEAINKEEIYMALSCGPTGEFFKEGKKNIDKVYESYKRIAKKAEECRVDVILLETIMNIQEVDIALKAIKENSKLPVFCTMSTWGGEDYFREFTVEEMCNVMERNSCDALGINCSDSPNHVYKLVMELLDNSKVPVMLKLNSGSVKNKNHKGDGRECAEDFSSDMVKYINKGVKIVGGCCGTTPEYIRLLSEKIN